jgi:hypothetical protein
MLPVFSQLRKHENISRAAEGHRKSSGCAALTPASSFNIVERQGDGYVHPAILGASGGFFEAANAPAQP